MFRFTDYANEIFAIAKAKAVDVGVAYSMFHADIRNGNDTNCGDAIDRDVLDKAYYEFRVLTSDEQNAAVDEWHDFIAECYAEACASFAEGEDAVAALVAEWRDNREDN